MTVHTFSKSLVLALCAVTLVGCGGGDDTDASSGSGGSNTSGGTDGGLGSGGTGGLGSGGSTGGGLGTGGVQGSYPGASYAKRLASGHDFNCAIPSDGSLYCWGSGSQPSGTGPYTQVAAYDVDL